MIPAVTQTEQDGAIGVLPAGTNIIAMVGVCDTGTAAVPAAYARVADVVTAFTGGPLVCFGAAAIENTGKPVLFCKCAASTAATEATLNIAGVTGTSVVTWGADTTANDDYEFVFTVTLGGTIGTGPISYTLSYDNGNTVGPVTSLGTANTLVFANSGGVGLAFAAGTLITGDVVKGRTYAPSGNSGDVVAALEALRLSAQSWDTVLCTSPIDGTIAAAVATEMALMPTKTFLGCFRMPLLTETEATYLTAWNTAFSGFANTYMGATAGAARCFSPATGRNERRPVLFTAGPFMASQSEEIDAAWVDLGSLAGTTIRDSNGNPVHHDETVNPGLDDARAIVLRTFANVQGVYINNPNMLSASGSDFQYYQHRRIMNLAKITLDAYFVRRLSKPVAVSAITGFILESEAQEIEAGAKSALRSVLMAKPKASAIDFTLSRTDNILSTKTMTGQASVVPLAYPKAINISVGFRNPALQVIRQ